MSEWKVASDAKSRFTGRAGAYAKYRPPYPRGILEILAGEASFGSGSVVADIGSGTGILSSLFLENGNTVYCVEPNADMRSAAEETLSSFSGFRSVAGSAEETSLQDKSVDLVTAGQSFHWFNPSTASLELRRISRNGTAAVIYNTRDRTGGLNTDYRELVSRFGRNFSPVMGPVEEGLRLFFSSYRRFTLPNNRWLTLDGLRGRLLSASYMPAEGEPAYGELMEAISDVFERHQKDGKVLMEMTTEIYLGSL